MLLYSWSYLYYGLFSLAWNSGFLDFPNATQYNLSLVLLLPLGLYFCLFLFGLFCSHFFCSPSLPYSLFSISPFWPQRFNYLCWDDFGAYTSSLLSSTFLPVCLNSSLNSFTSTIDRTCSVQTHVIFFKSNPDFSS